MRISDWSSDVCSSDLVLRTFDRGVQERLVRDDPLNLYAAGRGHDHLRRGVVDPGRELVRREAAEHHRMHGADPGAGEHRDGRFGDHRHVDDDPRSEENTSELQSLMRISYAVLRLKNKMQTN